MYIPDTLSRSMARKSLSKDVSKFNEETEAYVCSILDSLLVSDIKLQQIIEAQDNDEICKTIKWYCFENWPEKHLLPSPIRPYWTDRAHLTHSCSECSFERYQNRNTIFHASGSIG